MMDFETLKTTTIMNETTISQFPTAENSARDQSLPPGSPNSAGTPKRIPPYTIYKPNSRGDGGAVSFSLNKAKGAVFVEAANQSGERQFDWENKIIMKWGLPDLGAILAGLQGREPKAQLFHQTEKANSACSLVHREDPDQAPFLISVSRQDAEDKTVRKVTITLSIAEAAILETAIRTAISRVLLW